MPKNSIPIRFSGGMNNLHTALDLFLRQRGEVPLAVNVDYTYPGKIKILRPLSALNSTAEASSVHSLFVAYGFILVGSGTDLKYVVSTTLTSLITALSGSNITFCQAGNWVFLSDGINKKAIDIAGLMGTGGRAPVASDWGAAVPDENPTVSVGAAGNPNGTYTCYYRYKITLNDGTVIYTGLSPVAELAVANEKINWADLTHASFSGATTLQIELFRFLTGWAAIYLVTTLNAGTTTYIDDVSDATMQLRTAFAESTTSLYHYPPPDNISIVLYHPGADRIFMAVDNNVYWTEAALYHIVMYDVAAGEYENVNSVFLAGENVTAMVMFDEQLYIGSQRTWRRLRGRDPDYWLWEPTSATKGPMNNNSVVVTPWGILYPGNDGYLWMFNGYQAKRFIEPFVFDTKPDETCHATFDNRFYSLFYGDATYPEVVIDFYDYPSTPPRITKSTRSASASFYDTETDALYHGSSDGYAKSGEDTTENVTLTLQTQEFPPEDLSILGDMGALVVQADTDGNDLTITPYQDRVAQNALDAINNTSVAFEVVPMPFNQLFTLALRLSISSAGNGVEIHEPWLLRKDA